MWQTQHSFFLLLLLLLFACLCLSEVSPFYYMKVSQVKLNNVVFSHRC